MAWNLLGRGSSGVLSLDDTVLPDQGWAPGTRVQVLRQASVVSVSVIDLMRPEAHTGYRTVLVLPSGFRPPLDQYFTTWRGVRARILANGTVQVSSPGTALDYFTVTYPVTSPMPKGVA